jgi:hypothetical protein
MQKSTDLFSQIGALLLYWQHSTKRVFYDAIRLFWI